MQSQCLPEQLVTDFHIGANWYKCTVQLQEKNDCLKEGQAIKLIMELSDADIWYKVLKTTSHWFFIRSRSAYICMEQSSVSRENFDSSEISRQRELTVQLYNGVLQPIYSLSTSPVTAFGVARNYMVLSCRSLVAVELTLGSELVRENDLFGSGQSSQWFIEIIEICKSKGEEF
ncbi:unnamed protein product [Mytilus coruscus]|uniref:Uncharacterized protein n=1 Tax=Mytilus coruscus TaxID=42192 RepID=A0A6J8ETR8_MYTCO|nr:unnamed protein product [Mytilus coruscus]